MNTKPDNLSRSYPDQPSEFDRRRGDRVENESTLQELSGAIKNLLSGRAGSDSDVRAILHRGLRDGHIEDSTFQLVQGMLDRIAPDDIPPTTYTETLAEDRAKLFATATLVLARKKPDDGADGQIQVGSVLRDRFQLLEKIAGGGMGVVYKALDHRLREADGFEPWVALKVLDPELVNNPNAVRALQQEAAKCRCLSHPNIVRFMDIDRHDDMYFTVMEWLEGRSVANLLDDGKGGRIDYDTAMDIFQQAAAALEFAHRCGVVHAEVKPSNLIVTPSGTVKLIDFGMARVRQQSVVGPSFDSGLLGSEMPAYSSLQVLTGETPVPADDVFSLGCLLYRLIAGHRVFGPRSAAEAADNGMTPQRPQQIGDIQWRALKKSLAFSRVSRFDSVSAFLDGLVEEPGVYVSPDDTISTIPEIPHRKPWGLIASVTLAAVAAVLITQTDIVNGVRTFLDGAATVESGSSADSVVGEGAVVEENAVVEEGMVVEEGAVVEEGVVVEENLGPGVSNSKPALIDDQVAGLPADTKPAEIGEFNSMPVVDDPVVTDPPVEKVVTYAPIDYARLPPATIIIPLASRDGAVATVSHLTLLEDTDGAIIDLVRRSGINEPLTVDFDEIGFSGNRSPWESGQYQIADNAVVHFAAGQSRARTKIMMNPDPLREPDRTVTLRLRDGDDPASELATIYLRLEDDDQRAFEARLPANTVAFAVSRVSVRESDPAAQVDVIRFNPDHTALQIDYRISGVTATEGKDYFEPRSTTVYFRPGQRSARILVPLVQDGAVERDEAIVLELVNEGSYTDSDLFRRIAVMIRDDDSPGS